MLTTLARSALDGTGDAAQGAVGAEGAGNVGAFELVLGTEVAEI